MKKIFISYSRDDGGDLANYVIVHYEREGHQIFVARDDIELGDDWSERIENSIAESDVVAVIVTRLALRSLEVKKEVEEAKRQKKTIIPCVYKGIPWVDLKWDLNKLQGFDFDNKNSLVRQLDEIVFENISSIRNPLETETSIRNPLETEKSLGRPNIFSRLRDSLVKRLGKGQIDDTIDNSDIRLQKQGSEQPLQGMKRNQNEIKEPGSKAGERAGGTGVDQQPGDLSPPPSTAAKSEQNVKITRFPRARFPQKVVVEEVVPLEIVIKATKPLSLNKANTSIQLLAKPDETEIPVLVTVESTAGFELVGKEYYAIVLVPVGVEDSIPVIFKFKAKEEGNQNITIRFYQQQTYVGQIKINTEIERSSDELHTKLPITSQLKDWNLGVLPEKTPRGPDVTIYIQERRVSPDFEYGVLISSNEYAIKEMGPIKFSFNPETKFQKLFQDIENMNMAADVVDQKIRNKGITLYDELFPAQLKDLYWEKKIE